jgi:hypothetical protein
MGKAVEDMQAERMMDRLDLTKVPATVKQEQRRRCNEAVAAVSIVAPIEERHTGFREPPTDEVELAEKYGIVADIRVVRRIDDAYPLRATL